MTASDLLVVGNDHADVPSTMDVGGKGQSLFRMVDAGLPVPPYFVLTTAFGRRVSEAGGLDDSARQSVRAQLEALEAQTGLRYGSAAAPMLVSVRSSGPVSMPGMMDTILNVGIGADSLATLARRTSSLRWPQSLLSTLVSAFPDGAAPVDPMEQLFRAIELIAASWDSPRARLYRQMNRIAEDTGTAVVVQVMAFGNADDRSCSGVLFTRDPVTGVATPAANWAPSSQGEVIVSGADGGRDLASLVEWAPQVYEELLRAGAKLEDLTGWPQDVEFTVESDRLYLLQSRRMKMGPAAQLQADLDFHEEGRIDRTELTDRLRDIELDELVVDEVEPGEQAVAAGVPASPGSVAGICVRDPGLAIARAGEGIRVVLVRPDTSPKDLAAMKVSVAIVTERGGETCHAAIVARELGVPSVVGCGDLSHLADGDPVTVDGTQGRVYRGEVKVRRTVSPLAVRAAAYRQEVG